jgi:alpha-mannosidase
VLLASPDIPLFCIGDVVQGRWPKQLQLVGGRIFSYVLNNYWHTNYKASQGGAISFGYRLTSDRSITKDQAFRFGWTARRSLYGQRMSYQDFRQTRAPYTELSGGCLATIDTEQVIISTLKQAKWDEGLIIRLQEIAGVAQTATISFPGKKVMQAWMTDLLEHEMRELTVEADGALRVDVPTWGLTTIRIVLERRAGENDQ